MVDKEETPKHPADDVLNEVFGRRKHKWEEEIKDDGGFELDFKVVTEKEIPVDYTHKVIMSEPEFAKLWKYIKGLKKQIATLKKKH